MDAGTELDEVVVGSHADEVFGEREPPRRRGRP
jgi:hypothetical protein